MNPTKVYLDVAGTDRSSLFLGLPKGSRPLSTAGGCDIWLSNKGGAYKSAFSEMQRVAVSAARAAISLGDYFTGTDGAAPNVAKWMDMSAGGGTVQISGNKLKCTGVAGNGGRVRSAALTAPISFTVWAKTTSTAGYLEIEGKNGGGTDWWGIFGNGGVWKSYAYQGGGWALRASGGTCAANTWYRVKVNQTSATSVTFTIYDVFGVQVWTDTEAIDSLPSPLIWLGASFMAADVYFDSFLCTSSASAVADQLFEGVVDSIEYNSSPNTITLHCVDDAWELAAQYDETYGRGTAELDPSYGAVDDIYNYLIFELVPSGWTGTCPDCAIHDHIEISIGSRRMDAINQVVDHTPYLGWYVLPMKHIVFVMPDTSPAPDAWTEAIADWTGDNATRSVDATYNVDGINSLCLTSVMSGIFSGRRGDALNISLADYRFLILYAYTMGCTAQNLRIWTNIAGNKYWTIAIPSTSGWMADRTGMAHIPLRLPDSIGAHGWTATNAPSVTDPILRIQIEGITGIVGQIWFDILYFSANKKVTSKYTLSNIISTSHSKNADQVGQVVVVGSGITTVVCTDTTVTAAYGTREQMVNDQNITVAQKADAYARAFLNVQDWDDTADPIVVQIVNPGDMYNVSPGDTVTITAADLDLSNATRTIMSRQDSIGENGWLTAFQLSTTGYSDRIMRIWDAAKRKRY